MKPYRNLKIASLIQHELGEMITREFNFDGALVTIVDVMVGDKMEEAFVKLSILPLHRGPEMFKMIDNRRRELQGKLLRKMNIKPMPKLIFKIAE
jgi:ribosome-binding factor A